MPLAPVDFRLAETLADAAVALYAAQGRAATARTAVRLAEEAVTGADCAGLSLVVQGGLISPEAWTHDAVRAFDTAAESAAHRTHWDELWAVPFAHIDDTAECEGCARALEATGLRSVLLLRIRTQSRRFSVLSLASYTPRIFDDPAIRTARLLSTHIGVALQSATVLEQLTEALETRDVIGQATGILMEQLGIDAAQAFDRLVRASQQANVKVRDIALRIVGAAVPD
ncbi:ANTAR domain-containing protein [Streptomyces sp. NBC_01465]|uniref:ANTAR domain-containing protein n=1 Tax=Streptomyces sp. NBC_01465 TaxID=2903878 RepID=UPI002E3384DF|nr:ANTAR domain-containing protein [Streptomyces sp. NBC_01465]